jgi:HEAT repeat protein
MGTVDELIQKLQSSRSYKQRRDAASALGQLGDPKAVPALLQKLKDRSEDTEVLQAAALSIGKIGDLNTIPDLLDTYEIIGNRAAEAIHEAIGEILGRTAPDDDESREIFSRAVDMLVRTVQDRRKRDSERIAAVRALGESRDPKAIPFLVGTLHDPRTEVARAAAFALRHFDDPQVIHALTKAATNKKIAEGIREAAVMSLGNIGNPNAVDTLIQILEDRSEDGSLRTEAARALGRIGDPKAIEPLIRTLHNEWHKTMVDLRKAIIDALGAFRDPRVIDALVNALARDEDTARAAAEMLKKLRDRRAVERLTRLVAGDVEDAREHERELAADVLGALGDPRAIPALAKALHDDYSERLPKYAAQSLLALVPTHPDAILRLPQEDRNRLGRLIQEKEREELLKELCWYYR